MELKTAIVTLLMIKLTLTPFLMWAVSYASRRWGGAVGGLLAGMPLTSGPTSVYLAVEQGNGFAAQAAIGSVGAIGAVIVAYLAYVELSRRLALAWTIVGMLVVFVAAMAAFHASHLSLTATLVADIAFIFIVFTRCPRSARDRSDVEYPAWDFPARIVTSTSMVFLVTLSARWTGPVISGLISPLPVISGPLILFVQARQGRPEAMAVVRGTLQGLFGLLAFYTIVAVFLPKGNAVFVYTTGLLSSVVMTLPWLWEGRERREPLRDQ